MEDVPNFMLSTSCSETEVSYFHKKKKYSVYPKTEPLLCHKL